MSDELDNDQSVEPAEPGSQGLDVALMESDRAADETRPTPWPRWRPLPSKRRPAADEIPQFPAL